MDGLEREVRVEGALGGVRLCVLREELASWDLFPVVRSCLPCADLRKGHLWTAGCGRWVEQTA